MKPVCLVLGAGAGIGGNVAKKFSKEGVHLCICRRTDEKGLFRQFDDKYINERPLWKTF